MFRMHLAAKFLFGVSHDVEVRFQLGHSHLKAVLRWISKRAHSQGWQLLMAVGLELRWSCQPERLHMAFLAWWSQVRQNCYIMAASPRVSISEVPGRCFLVFSDLPLEIKIISTVLSWSSHNPSQIQRKKTVYIYQWEQQQGHMWNRTCHFGN